MPANHDIALRLHSAVMDGVVDPETAERLLPYLRSNDEVGGNKSDADEEQFRLVTGFNDIFVTIGLVMFLGALFYLLSSAELALASGLVAMACWLLSEFFTLRKRMALPSIVLLLAFTGMVLIAAFLLFSGVSQAGLLDRVSDNGLTFSFAALIAAVTAAAHWLRFKVPITVAAGCAALMVMLLAILNSIVPGVVTSHPVPVFLPTGLAIFAAAMWFDTSDRSRLTRRTDIAFWLHLLAAPVIVHPVIRSLGVTGESVPADAIAIVAIFSVLCVVALVVDRRALLVSSLSYLAYAAYSLVIATGWSTSATAIAVFVVGAIVLLLSAAWRPLRYLAVRTMPSSIRARVPKVA